MSAIAFKTENSVYKLELCNEGFRCTKIAEVRPNHNGINIGFTRTGWSIFLRIGEPAYMGSLITSEVTDIMDYDIWFLESIKKTSPTE